LHITAGEFRARYDCASMFARFRADLIIPYTEVLCCLRPLTPPMGWSPNRLERMSRRRTLPRDSGESREGVRLQP
jgi:hypothetical protein